MIVGHLPPFLMWPYVLYCIVKGQSLWPLLNELTETHRTYMNLSASIRQRLEEIWQEEFSHDSETVQENNQEGGSSAEIVRLVRNGLILFSGGVSYGLLEAYIYLRHLNNLIFVAVLYLSRIRFSSPHEEGNGTGRTDGDTSHTDNSTGGHTNASEENDTGDKDGNRPSDDTGDTVGENRDNDKK